MKNNKGFTLVELIIVIAIIAILATVLVPQYLRYVEESRIASDLQVAANLVNATSAAIIALDETSHQAGGYIVHWRTDRAKDPNYNNATFTVLTYDFDTDSQGGADTNLRNTIGDIMGWNGADGVYHDNDDLVTNGQSDLSQTYRFAFVIDATTGNTAVHRGYSEPWVTEMGLAQPLHTS